MMNRQTGKGYYIKDKAGRIRGAKDGGYQYPNVALSQYKGDVIEVDWVKFLSVDWSLFPPQNVSNQELYVWWENMIQIAAKKADEYRKLAGQT